MASMKELLALQARRGGTIFRRLKSRGIITIPATARIFQIRKQNSSPNEYSLPWEKSLTEPLRVYATYQWQDTPHRGLYLFKRAPELPDERALAQVNPVYLHEYPENFVYEWDNINSFYHIIRNQIIECEPEFERLYTEANGGEYTRQKAYGWLVSKMGNGAYPGIIVPYDFLMGLIRGEG